MRFKSNILAATALIAAASLSPAYAADSRDAQIDALEKQVQDLARQIQALKQDQTETKEEVQAQVVDLKRSTSTQYADVQNQRAADGKVSLPNGRPTFTSGDGKFTAALRGLGQFDSAYYSQDSASKHLPAALGPDLSSGANFRRGYLGIQGTAFGDWSYYLNLDFGGSNGTENPARIQSLYAQYDGLKPWGFRIGAYPPPSNIEDSTSAGDTIFLERNAPSDLQRNIAGGDGRDAVTVLYTGEQLFGALSYTGGKVGDAAVFDEQQGLVGRASYLLHSDPDSHLIIGANGTYLIKPAEAVVRGAATFATTPGAAALSTFNFNDPPELTVDSTGTRLANTGALPVNHVSQWGLEAAGNYKNFYGQGGYYNFTADRSNQAYRVFTSAAASNTHIVSPDSNSFSGWYLQGTWILTGEARPYNAATGSFQSPRPSAPFSIDGGGIGAWEVAARYSDLDLNDNVSDASNVITGWTGAANRTYTYYNTVRGGDQKIWTAALNWYPNNFFKFGLDYMLIDIDRLQSPATVTTTGTPLLPSLKGGQTVQAIAFRTQVSF